MSSNARNAFPYFSALGKANLIAKEEFSGCQEPIVELIYLLYKKTTIYRSWRLCLSDSLCFLSCAHKSWFLQNKVLKAVADELKIMRLCKKKEENKACSGKEKGCKKIYNRCAH